MIAGIVGALAQTLINASVDQQRSTGSGQGRAYYNWLVTGVACLLPALFLLFFFASLPAAIQGQGGAWQFVLVALVGLAAMVPMVATQIIRREAVWDEKGVRFRWLTGEANLEWDEIEKVEIRQYNRGHARITFRDGRTFGMGAQFTGCNALLRDIALREIPFFQWGTTKPLKA